MMKNLKTGSKTVPYRMEDFHGGEFYKYPKWLFHDPDLKSLSARAKQLYMFFLNRSSLSFKNADRFKDEEGQIYFICTRAEMQELLGCGYHQPRIYVHELMRYGLLQDKRIGLNRPNHLYLFKPDTAHKPSDLQDGLLQSIKMDYNDPSRWTDSIHQDGLLQSTLLKENKTYIIETEGEEEAEASPMPPPEEKNPYGEYKNVLLTDNDYAALVDAFGQTTTNDYIIRVDEHIESTGKKYNNHRATIAQWINQDRRKAKKGEKPAIKPSRFANFTQRKNDNVAFERMHREMLMKELENESDV